MMQKLLLKPKASQVLINSARFAQFSVAARRFPNEPEMPHLVTSFPGPKTAATTEKFGQTSCNKQTHFPIDLQESLGNYIADPDGNKYLDMFTSISAIAMGYNHPSMLEASKSQAMKRIICTRLGLGINPPIEYEELIKDAFMDMAPKGLNRVSAAMCGTCSVEGALKLAFISYA